MTPLDKTVERPSPDGAVERLARWADVLGASLPAHLSQITANDIAADLRSLLAENARLSADLEKAREALAIYLEDGDCQDFRDAVQALGADK